MDLEFVPFPGAPAAPGHLLQGCGVQQAVLIHGARGDGNELASWGLKGLRGFSTSRVWYLLACCPLVSWRSRALASWQPQQRRRSRGASRRRSQGARWRRSQGASRQWSQAASRRQRRRPCRRGSLRPSRPSPSPSRRSSKPVPAEWPAPPRWKQRMMSEPGASMSPRYHPDSSSGLVSAAGGHKALLAFGMIWYGTA